MVCRDNHARACQRSRNTAPMLIQSGGAKSDAKADTPPMRRSAQAAEAQPGVLRARAVSTSLSRSAPTTNESAGSPSRKHIEPFDRSGPGRVRYFFQCRGNREKRTMAPASTGRSLQRSRWRISAAQSSLKFCCRSSLVSLCVCAKTSLVKQLTLG